MSYPICLFFSQSRSPPKSDTIRIAEEILTNLQVLRRAGCPLLSTNYPNSVFIYFVCTLFCLLRRITYYFSPPGKIACRFYGLSSLNQKTATIPPFCPFKRGFFLPNPPPLPSNKAPYSIRLSFEIIRGIVCHIRRQGW